MTRNARMALMVGLLGVLGCSKKDVAAHEDASADASVTVPVRTTPPAIHPFNGTLTGRLERKPTWTWIAGTGKPGTAKAAAELAITDVKISTLPDAKSLKGKLRFDQTHSAGEVPPVSPATVTKPELGSCKATLRAHDTLDNVLILTVHEPGCDTAKLTKEPWTGPFVASALATSLSKPYSLSVMMQVSLTEPP